MTRTALAFAIAGLLFATTACATKPASPRPVEDVVIVDTHIDAPTALLAHWHDLGIASDAVEFDYPRARQGGLDVAFMSIYTSADEDEAGKAWQIANTQIDAVEALAARHPEKFALLRSPGDVEKRRSGDRVLLAFGMENGGPIGDELSQLAKFHARGVRYLTLAHGRSNRISDSATDSNRPWKGLSPFGERVVGEMNRLGIMIDVSHLSDDAVREAVALSRVPVIASHSALRHFTPGFERNLSDELVLAIAAKGGVVQIPFGKIFIDADAAAAYQTYLRAREAFRRDKAAALAAGKPTPAEPQFPSLKPVAIDAVLDHIDHVVKLVGIDHVGLGSDFDGVRGELPDGLRSVADYPNLIAGLQKRGYDERDIAKILGGNLLRVWNTVEAAAQPAAR